MLRKIKGDTMQQYLPAARNRRRALVMIALVSVLILLAVGLTTAQIFNTVLEGKKVEVANQLHLFKGLLESSTHKDAKESAKDLLIAYQDSINKVPEGVIEYFIAWRRATRTAIWPCLSGPMPGRAPSSC
jgi:hypothetical protein